MLPLEIIAASITLTYWNPAIPKSIFVTIFLVFVVIINFFGVRGYGEAEFVFAIIKVTAVIGFMFVFSPSASWIGYTILLSMLTQWFLSASRN